ncbi:MAG: glycosyltransferase family 4 protein [Tepidisphaeraceae bacterium]|jgi:glycosyltransferase involved in cell wall biosynthesis
MHVLILNQPFYPEVAATAQLMWDLAQDLDRHGHNVTAICSRHVYGTDQSHAQAYEKIGHIEFRRVGGTRFGRKNLVGRMSDFLSFYAAAFIEMQKMPAPDVILALSSPPMISLLGVFKRIFGRRRDGGRVRLVYHVMDVYPDAAIAMGVLKPRSIVARIMSRLTRFTLENSDGIIALGRDMADLISQRYGIPRQSVHLHVIPPWSDGQQLHPMPRTESTLARQWGATDTFNLAYSGNLGMAHDVNTIAGAIERLKDDTGLRWLFIGGGNRFKAMQERAGRNCWKNVTFHPYQERAALLHSLNAADVHLVSQLPAFTGIVVPSKLYGIMAVGRPGIMIGPDDAECSRTIVENGAGYVVPIGDVDGLVARIRELRENEPLRLEMGRRAREAFERLYDRPIACNRIRQVLEGVVP